MLVCRQKSPRDRQERRPTKRHQPGIRVSLTARVDQSQPIGDQALWQYASTPMSNNRTGRHGLTALDHFNAKPVDRSLGMSPVPPSPGAGANAAHPHVQKHASYMSAAH